MLIKHQDPKTFIVIFGRKILISRGVKPYAPLRNPKNVKLVILKKAILHCYVT